MEEVLPVRQTKEIENPHQRFYKPVSELRQEEFTPLKDKPGITKSW
ncbi:MAG: hypothetical protein SW833_05065 [Cyanobacteriota bacterium]|nr:hypothetical protein [Cyanobacteriota bacterium]